MSKSTIKKREILLVEDNPADIEIFKTFMDEYDSNANLYVCTDGEKAEIYLNQIGVSNEVSFPDLIILDLNLPKINGHELLKFIKTNDRLKRIPVILLTSSQAEEDIVRSYDLYVNCYITKPVDFDQSEEMIARLKQFWFETVTLPPNATKE